MFRCVLKGSNVGMSKKQDTIKFLNHRFRFSEEKRPAEAGLKVFNLRYIALLDEMQKQDHCQVEQ